MYMAPYVSLAILACWLVFFAVWLVMAFSAKRYARRGGALAIWLRLGIAVVFIAIYQIPSSREFLLGRQFAFTDPIVQWIGVAITACGVAFAIWARMYLGRNWGMPMSLKQDAELVTTGPYEYVRHPIYTGMITALLGSTLVFLWWLLPLVCFFIYFVYAAKTEEKIMLNEFPDQYPDYMKRTKMLIPFIF